MDYDNMIITLYQKPCNHNSYITWNPSSNFGAQKFVKTCLKIIMKNIQNFPYSSFYSVIQNLSKILSWPLNQSCREFNFEQLLFLGQFQKMSSSCSNFGLKFEIHLN
jgi:hypothetical protein